MQMTEAGEAPGPETLPIINDEIDILERMAGLHPSKASKIESLRARWNGLRMMIRGAMH